MKQFNWKHLGIALFLTIALCVGFMLYNQWDVTHFKKSLVEDTTQTPQKIQSKKSPETPQKQTKLTPPESELKNNEIQVDENKNKNEKDADFYDFLDFLDKLEEEEVVKLIESLDLEEDEKKAIADLAEQESDTTENIHPSNMIVDLMESGVASLADLIELMEESSTVMSESVQQRFEPVLQTLRTMQKNGGGLIFHRPPADTSNFILVYINPSPSQQPQLDLDADNLLHEIPSDDPSKGSLFLHKGNSIIID